MKKDDLPIEALPALLQRLRATLPSYAMPHGGQGGSKAPAKSPRSDGSE